MIEIVPASLLVAARSERARLAERLIASLDDYAEIEQAWIVEAERRLDAFRNGEIEAVSAEEALQEARRRIHKL